MKSVSRMSGEFDRTGAAEFEESGGATEDLQ